MDTESTTTASCPPASKESLPTLYRDRSFWGMVITQFLGAFNDNLFKQLMLLLAVPLVAFAASKDDQQWLAQIVFALPFVLFSGFAGYLSDRFPKRRIIVASKVAEITVMLLGMGAFLAYSRFGYSGLLAVLFLMGLQSTFFGPGKYGILPEMLREKDLARANGFILMTTFVAIILGTASAGKLGESLLDTSKELGHSAPRLANASMICIVIATIGTATSLLIRNVPAARKSLKFQTSSVTIPPETRRVLANDRKLLLALLASCVFWLVSGTVMPSVNSLGLMQLGEDMERTSYMVAVIGIGISLGAVVAGKLSKSSADFRMVRIGSWGIVVCLGLLSITISHGEGSRHLLGYGGSLLVLILLGAMAGAFAIPLQVFIQARPPAGQKGRMIAVMNQANFIAILLSGFAYRFFDRIVVAAEWPRSMLFALIALIMIPVAIFYRPVNEQGDFSQVADI